jgi:hypothetical protein
MPFRAPRICKRCKKKTDIPGPRCSKCKKGFDERNHAKEVAYQASRPTKSQRGYSKAWRNFSKMYRRQHPLCQCYQLNGEAIPCGRYTNLVHHLDGDPSHNPSDGTNHLAMANYCHKVYHAKTNRWKVKNDGKRISNRRQDTRRKSDDANGEIVIGRFLG